MGDVRWGNERWRVPGSHSGKLLKAVQSFTSSVWSQSWQTEKATQSATAVSPVPQMAAAWAPLHCPSMYSVFAAS